MKSLFTFCSFLLLIHCVKAQQKIDSTALKYSAFINKEDLSKHLHVLASDEYEGRETGKAGQKKAAAYIAAQFKTLGIPAVIGQSYFQSYNVVEQAPNGEISIRGKSYEFIRDFYYFHGFSDTVIKSNKILLLGYGIDDPVYSDYTGAEVKGKILLLMDGEPMDKKGKSLITKSKKLSLWSSDQKKKIQLAKSKGAAAVIVLKNNYSLNLDYYRHYIEKPSMMLEMDTVDSDYKAQKRRLHTFYFNEDLAPVFLGDKSLAAIRTQIAKTKKTVRMELNCEIEIKIDRDNEVLSAENVLAYIEGTDKKDELVIITAHYDHIGMEGDKVFNGADDDGSGTVALLELAEAFQEAAKAGKRPRRSILIMMVSGEEKGLLGSYYYSEYPVFPLAKTVVDLNIDMIGRLDKDHENNPNYIYLIGSNILSDDLHTVSEKANELYTGLQLDYKYNDLKDPNRFYYRSDHYNFAKKNIPVIFYFNGVHEDYHQATDDVEKIDFLKMEKITRLVFFTAWEIANREERIQLKTP